MSSFNTEVSFKALEPGIIDEELIRKALDEQGPKGEANRLLTQDGIKLEEVKSIRLEFLNILAIDHLWMMASLVKLDLSNNIIEKIENLDNLVNLKVLSLSFNNIEKIENMDALVNLEILTLFENAVSRIENLDSLSKLMILSLGNNKICNWDNVVYLRKFQSLRSLNMTGNPCCTENPNGDSERNKSKGPKLDEIINDFGDGNDIDPKCRKDEFRIYTVAHLPMLRFYGYSLVNEGEKEVGQQKYRHKLLLLQEEEEKEKLASKKAREEAEFLSKGKAAWVDKLHGSEFIDDIFEIDHFGKAMSSLDENMQEIYEEFHTQFMDVTTNLYDMALVRKVERDNEEKQFVECLQKAKDETGDERKIIMTDLFIEKDQYFKKVVTLIESLEDNQGAKPEANVGDGSKLKPASSLAEVEEEEESEEYEVMGQIQTLNCDFSDLCQRILENLMALETHLYEQIEETLASYERKITDLVNTFIENAQVLFVSCRDLETGFSERMATAVPRYFNATRARIAASKMVRQEEGASNLEQQESCPIVPKILEECLESKDALQNAIASSHDIHVQMIDAREDQLISEAKNWLKENLAEHSRNEVQGNRERLYEIITVINQVKEEFEELQASLVTLPMLADMEIIDG